jgi:HK97 family phage portal protein
VASLLRVFGRRGRGRVRAAAAAASRRIRFPNSGTMYGGYTASPEQLMNSMSTVSTLFAIVERLQTSTSSVEWRLYYKSNTDNKADRKPVKSHASIDLWRKPNSHMTGRQFREISQQHIELTGETPWIVPKVGTLPVELWPVRPDRVEPQPHPEKFISNYWYTGGGLREYLECGEVIRQMMPHPTDPYRGLGPVQALLTHIDSVRYSQEWNRSFFENDASPGGILEYPHSMTDKELKEFTERWDDAHRGSSNAHRVAMLENGLKWVDRNYTMRDMQFVELSELSREIIREGFGFPRPMLGSVDDVNRANAEAGEVVFGRWLLVPRLERIRDALNFQLLPMYGSASANDLEWDFAPPVPEDRAADNESLRNKIEMWKLLVDAGVSDEDAAQLVGLPPIKRSAPAPAPAPAAAPAAPPAGDDEPEPDEPAEDDEPDEPDDDREPVAAGAQRVSRG